MYNTSIKTKGEVLNEFIKAVKFQSHYSNELPYIENVNNSRPYLYTMK
jgi:hypothetical protein